MPEPIQQTEQILTPARTLRTGDRFNDWLVIAAASRPDKDGIVTVKVEHVIDGAWETKHFHHDARLAVRPTVRLV